MIYVDEAIYKRSANGRKNYCHMIADSVEELHDNARWLGIGKHFFHGTAKYPHYDLTEIQRENAIKLGAKAITTRELIELSKKLLEATTVVKKVA